MFPRFHRHWIPQKLPLNKCPLCVDAYVDWFPRRLCQQPAIVDPNGALKRVVGRVRHRSVPVKCNRRLVDSGQALAAVDGEKGQNGMADESGEATAADLKRLEEWLHLHCLQRSQIADSKARCFAENGDIEKERSVVYSHLLRVSKDPYPSQLWEILQTHTRSEPTNVAHSLLTADHLEEWAVDDEEIRTGQDRIGGNHADLRASESANSIRVKRNLPFFQTFAHKTHFEGMALFKTVLEAQRVLVPAGADCILRQVSSSLKLTVALELEPISKMPMERPWVCILIRNASNEYTSWGVVKYTDLVMRQSKTRPHTVTIRKSDCRPSIEPSLPYAFEDDCQLPPEFNLDDVERLMSERYTEAGKGVSMEWNLLSYRLCVQAISRGSPRERKKFLEAETRLAIQRLTWEHMALVLLRHTERGGYVRTVKGRRIRTLYADVCDAAEHIEARNKHISVQNGRIFATAPVLMPYVLKLISSIHESNATKQRTVPIEPRLWMIYQNWRTKQFPNEIIVAPPPPPRPTTIIDIEACFPACMRELWSKGTNKSDTNHLRFEERNVLYRFALKSGMPPEKLKGKLQQKAQESKYFVSTIVPAVKSTVAFITKHGDQLKDESCGTIMGKLNGQGQSMCPFHRFEGADWKEAGRRCHSDQSAITRKQQLPFAQKSTPMSVADNISKHITIQLSQD